MGTQEQAKKEEKKQSKARKPQKPRISWLQARKPQKSRSVKMINKTPAIDCRQSTQKGKKEDLGACISDSRMTPSSRLSPPQVKKQEKR
jgi:hypothetical protein